MKRPRVRRRWVVLALLLLLALVVLRLLYQPLELASYRVDDPDTITVVGYGAKNVWTRVAGVTETDAAVTVSVDALTFEPFPHTGLGYPIEVLVGLKAPLGGRAVIDGSTGFSVARSP
jgi:hypothetical protein